MDSWLVGWEEGCGHPTSPSRPLPRPHGLHVPRGVQIEGAWWVWLLGRPLLSRGVGGPFTLMLEGVLVVAVHLTGLRGAG